MKDPNTAPVTIKQTNHKIQKYTRIHITQHSQSAVYTSRAGRVGEKKFHVSHMFTHRVRAAEWLEQYINITAC